MTRRPVRRRRRSTTVRRVVRQAKANPLPSGIAALVVLALAVTMVRWLAQHLVLVAALLALGAVAGLVVLRSRARTRRRELEARTAQLRHIGPFLAMTPKAFEHALADLCRRDGCTKVTVVGGAGDLAADVLAVTPTGQRLLIQAKRYGPKTFVGSHDVQKVNGTYRDVHHCDLAAVVTTSSFTKAAAAFCTQVGIRTVDRRALALWADGRGGPPWA
ncbi:restriction endonuclease [Streptomyces sp. CBMA156]|uniref:restriction endonuclease n=1 Tax=Streptomyces sp. CBMA156 TaxID=1930280 RepID=UPI001661BB17|nr:restriction endonuclease [Streptomyces sp. CBMA156]